jgi:F-type H+-transporting ATPase subunit b
MSFDPWTLAFQLLNFAVLLLVLFRLLFKPVREIMAKRAAQVQAALAAADKARAEAEQLKAGLVLERERVGALRAEMLEKLRGEIEEHRQRRLAGVDAEAKSLLDRGRAVLESEQRKAGEELRERARRSVTDTPPRCWPMWRTSRSTARCCAVSRRRSRRPAPSLPG